MKQRILFFVLMFLVGAFSHPIKELHILGGVGKPHIDEKNKLIFTQVNYYGKNGIYPLSKAKVETFKLTSDTLTHTLPDTLDLRNYTEFKIGEELWKIKGGYQLPSSRFDKWHTEDVSGFLTIGSKTCDEMVGPENGRIWDNGNPAVAIAGTKDWPTRKVKLKDGSYAAELTTKKILGIIASGNLFTGRIVRDISLKQLLGFTSKDGKALITWGVPFEARPKGFRVKFKYEGLGDSCTVMATLENHQNGERRFVGVAWYSATSDNDTSKEGVVRISKPDENGLRTLETSFIFGRSHKNADPLPEGVLQGAADEPITHVNVVFASSRKGDYFKGKKNARLTVQNFEFVY